MFTHLESGFQLLQISPKETHTQVYQRHEEYWLLYCLQMAKN